MKIHIPHLRHKKLKNLGKNLHWATSSTNKDPNPLDNPGGSKNEYFLHEDPFVRRQQICDRNYRTLQKYIEAIKVKNESEMGFAEKQEARYSEIKRPVDRRKVS